MKVIKRSSGGNLVGLQVSRIDICGIGLGTQIWFCYARWVRYFGLPLYQRSVKCCVKCFQAECCTVAVLSSSRRKMFFRRAEGNELLRWCRLQMIFNGRNQLGTTPYRMKKYSIQLHLPNVSLLAAPVIHHSSVSTPSTYTELLCLATNTTTKISALPFSPLLFNNTAHNIMAPKRQPKSRIVNSIQHEVLYLRLDQYSYSDIQNKTGLS